MIGVVLGQLGVIWERIAGGAIGLHRLSGLAVFDGLVAGSVPASGRPRLHAGGAPAGRAFDTGCDLTDAVPLAPALGCSPTGARHSTHDAGSHSSPRLDPGLDGLGSHDQRVDRGHDAGWGGAADGASHPAACHTTGGAQSLAPELTALVPARDGARLCPVKQAAKEAFGSSP